MQLLGISVFPSKILSRFNEAMCDLNLKAQFLHLVEELETDHKNIRLFVRPSGISLYLHQSLPKDFHCLTWVGTQPMSPCTAKFGVYLPTPIW